MLEAISIFVFCALVLSLVGFCISLLSVLDKKISVGPVLCCGISTILLGFCIIVVVASWHNHEEVVKGYVTEAKHWQGAMGKVSYTTLVITNTDGSVEKKIPGDHSDREGKVVTLYMYLE